MPNTVSGMPYTLHKDVRKSRWLQRILVTGGSGFIGGHLARALVQKGYKVVIMDRENPRAEMRWWLSPVWTRLQFVQAGVEDWFQLVSAMRSHYVDGVVHLAAIANPTLLKDSPGSAIRANFLGTYNVLAAAQAFRVRRVVYFSSIGVLPSIQYEPIDVNHPVLLGTEGPGSGFYGASKLAGEAFCWAFHDSYGLDFMILRPSAVYGFGMSHAIYIKTMVEQSLLGNPVRFPHGRNFPRDYTHVHDVVQLAIKALEHPPGHVKDRVFYAATGLPLVTAKQVAEHVKRLIPHADIRIGRGYSKSDSIELKYRGRLDISNAVMQLKYRPQFAEIQKGLEEYIATYMKYLSQEPPASPSHHSLSQRGKRQ
jgi:UDP-glucose 4-epimerase